MHTCSPAIVYAHMEYTCTHAHNWRIVTPRVHLHTSQRPFHSLTQRTNTCILFCDTDCLEGYSGPFRNTQPGLISWNLILAGWLPGCVSAVFLFQISLSVCLQLPPESHNVIDFFFLLRLLTSMQSCAYGQPSVIAMAITQPYEFYQSGGRPRKRTEGGHENVLITGA